jgi:hypothetical protein
MLQFDGYANKINYFISRFGSMSALAYQAIFGVWIESHGEIPIVTHSQ